MLRNEEPIQISGENNSDLPETNLNLFDVLFDAMVISAGRIDGTTTLPPLAESINFAGVIQL